MIYTCKEIDGCHNFELAKLGLKFWLQFWNIPIDPPAEHTVYWDRCHAVLLVNGSLKSKTH